MEEIAKGVKEVEIVQLLAIDSTDVSNPYMPFTSYLEASVYAYALVRRVIDNVGRVIDNVIVETSREIKKQFEEEEFPEFSTNAGTISS